MSDPNVRPQGGPAAGVPPGPGAGVPPGPGRVAPLGPGRGAPPAPPPGTQPPAAPPPSAPSRSADARLARVHLRGGLLPLARAALEQMAGAGTLDREACVDLAEVRWRSGDLEGAAEAANAHLASGGGEPMAHLILSEDLFRRGREAEALHHAGIVHARVGDAVGVLFAGEPRGGLWPPEDPGWMDVQANAAGRWGLLVGGGEVAAPGLLTWTSMQPAPSGLVPSSVQRQQHMLDQLAPVPRPGQRGVGARSPTAVAVMSGRAAGQELQAAERSVAEGRVQAACDRLAVLLRMDPALAPVILTLADRAAAAVPPSGEGRAAIHVLRGDALRILGHEIEAEAAFTQASQALSTGPTAKETS